MLKLKTLLSVLLLILCSSAYAQTRTITGKITGAGSLPVSAATITEKGTRNSKVTDENGDFSITVTTANPVLVISSVGYGTKEFPVQAGSDVLNGSLETSKGELNEVVVTALGITRTSKSLVYTTQVIKPAELTGVRDANNVLNSLSGKVANATISQGSGGVGSGARIVLRGNRSIQGDNNALIVVDGVPIDNSTYSSPSGDFGAVQGSDGASSINPDDIESMTVLSGASAAALYGSQAGNGVIVITTKKGSRGKTTVGLNSGVQFESIFQTPKFQNSYGQGNDGKYVYSDSAETIVDPTFGDSWGPKMTGQPWTNYLGGQTTYSAHPNNVKDFFRTGASFNNSVSVSGGGEKGQTYVSYTNNSLQGVVPLNNLLRHTITVRQSNQISKIFSTDAKITYLNEVTSNRPRTGEENSPVMDIYNTPRNLSTAELKQYSSLSNIGVAEPTPYPSPLTSIYQNAYWMLNETAINQSRDRIMGFLSLKAQFLPWLSFTGRANLDKTMDKISSQYAQGTLLWAVKPGGHFDQQNITTTQKWFDGIFEGVNNIGKDFKINYHVGGIFQDRISDQLTNTADGLNVTNKFSLNYATTPSIVQTGEEVQTEAAFAQATISWRDAVFVDGSFRNDWDSRLPKPYTFQYYSLGASAIISDLVKLPTAISFLKAKLNYAQVGNGGQFGLLTTPFTYSQGAGNGYLQRGTTLPFPTLQPEIVKSLEAGLDFKFLSDRLGIGITYYKSNSSNQLLKINLPVGTGYSNQYINAGNIQNQGFEITVSATPMQSKDFSWNIAFNLGLNRNKVIKLTDSLKEVFVTGDNRSATPRIRTGSAYGDLVSYKWIKNAQGQYRVNPDGTPLTTYSTGEDQDYIGNFNPRATLGLTNSFRYKAFSLRVLIDGRVGGVIVDGTEMNLAFSGITKGTDKYREGGWVLGGVDSAGKSVTTAIDAQQFWQTASGKRYGVGQFFAYDATNFRLREVSLGYDIPVGQGTFVKGARISAIARNLFWIYRGKSILNIPGLGARKMEMDPDISQGNGNYQGVQYGSMPSTRSYGFNLQVTF